MKGRRLAYATMVSFVIGTLGAASCQAPRAGTVESVLTAQPCEGSSGADARCYSLAVPENRAVRGGRTIRLRIVVLPASGEPRAPDPVFYLAGGPGQAASSQADGVEAADALRAHRDLVFADQRGTGGSNPLECRFYGPPDDAQSYFREFLPIEKVRECRAELERGADLSQYTTAASVEDLEAIRVAMGSPQLNLIGGSYGTRLAMEYVRRYEKHVRTVVLEGPVTPTMHAPEAFGRMAAAALDGLIDECAATPDCARAFPAFREESAAVFERLRRGPVTAVVAHPASKTRARVTLTRNHVAEAIRYLMYSSRGASRVPLLIHRAYHGDFGPIADFLIRWRADGTFDGLYLSITCAEDVPFVASDAAERDDPTYLGGYRVREQRAACAEWARGKASPVQFEPVASRTPVLVISGKLDPVTPSAKGDELVKTLPNAVHLRVEAGGHSTHGLGGLECLSSLQRDFIERGGSDRLDVSCVKRISRPAFQTGR